MKTTLCKHCDNFIEENHVDGKITNKTETTITVNGETYARYIHLEDGESIHSFDHDAEPGETRSDWETNRPDLFVEHADGRIGPNSDFHGNQRGKKLVPWSTAYVFNMQKTEPVYLTSAICEPAHGNPTMFKELGLSFKEKDKWQVSDYGDYPATVEGEEGWGTSYPLTKEEEQYIGDSGIEGPFGGAGLGYSVLYQGKKWLSPCIEICWTEGGRFSESSYGGTALKTSVEAQRAAEALKDKLASKVEALGGMVYIDLDMEGDRHSVLLMFPLEAVQKIAQDFKGWETYIGSLIN